MCSQYSIGMPEKKKKKNLYYQFPENCPNLLRTSKGTCYSKYGEQNTHKGIKQQEPKK